ncbi:MAG: site-specific integrase [Ignavibacteria bacterium]|nr:site-specific integrase [Ignavibacteria bacterium]
MKLTFYADKPSEVRTPIMVRLSLSGHRLRFGTGISTETRYWNPEKQEFRSQDPNRNSHTKRKDLIEQFIKSAYNDMTPSGKDKLLSKSDIESLVEKIRNYLSPSHQNTAGEASFDERFEEFIATYTLRTRSGQITSHRPSNGTIVQYRRCLTLLREWAVFKKRTIAFEIVDEAFYNSFCEWLGTAKSMRDASIANHVKVLKIFMKWAFRKGYHTTTAWESFWRDKRTGETMALTVDELRRIRDVDLTDKPRLARVRDIFLLQAYTGMRYGDLERLTPDHFDEKAGIIRYTSGKTNTKCIVPITPPLRALLTRYPSRLFEFPSSVKANLYLKELGIAVGLNESITISHYRAGKRVDERMQRCELLTTHVARRSFASTSVQFGLSEAVISRVTGHAARGVLQQHYIILNDEAVRDMVCKAWEQL